MKIWVLHSKIRHTANYFIITWNFLTVKIIFCIKKNDTKSVHPPKYISKSVQNAKSSDQKILTTYPSPTVSRWLFLTIEGPNWPSWVHCHYKKIGYFALIFYESRYLPEIFRVSSSHAFAKLTKKFWPLLNQLAR